MLLQTIVALFAFPGNGLLPADTLDAVTEVKQRLGQYYDMGGRYRHLVGNAFGDYFGWHCSGDAGVDCFGGDWMNGPCPEGFACHSDPGRLLEVLIEQAMANHESGYVTGQAVFSLVRFGRPLQAMEVVEACEADAWWCDALAGHVVYSVGRLDEAERRFRAALAEAPDSVACSLQDPALLHGAWPWTQWMSLPERPGQLMEVPCSRRSESSDGIWGFADPLYIVPGNDRWTAHVNRALVAQSFQETREAVPGRKLSAMTISRTAHVLRRGPWDSFEVRVEGPESRGGSWGGYASISAARYHFVPDFAEDDEDLSHPIWRLEATRDDEGYTPPYGPFYRLPLQVARFRHHPEGDSLHIATAGLTTGSPIEGAASSAYLVLSDAPESFPLQLEAPFHEGRAVFLPQTPAERYVVSFEVLSEAGIGRHRLMLEPLETAGPGLSDLLLYRPMGAAEPDSLLAAASLMLGTTAIDDPAEVGLYWELYGVDAGETVEFELQVERLEEDGAFLQRIRRRLPGGAEEAQGGRLAREWSALHEGDHARPGRRGAGRVPARAEGDVGVARGVRRGRANLPGALKAPARATPWLAIAVLEVTTYVT